MNKKIFGFIFASIIIFTPAAVSFAAGIVPDCGKVVTTIGADGKESSTMSNPCDFNYFMELLNKIIKFLLFTIATPFIALIIMYTGYLYLTAGGSAGQTEKAKHILTSVIFGYLLALGAWLIVNTILKSFNIDDPEINTFLKQ